MKITRLEFLPVSVPYTHREVSSRINRDGVTDIVVTISTDAGLRGRGESCSGANTESVLEALRAMVPFALGRSPWESEAIRAELWQRGVWTWRQPTAAFAYAGIDMALWDICGQSCGQPLYNLFGGKLRDRVNYFYYLAQGSPDEIASQCRDGLSKGFTVFYLKVGIDISAELDMVRTIRETAGPAVKIRLDANTSWTVNEAVRNLALLDQWRIDFIEQPVIQDPLANMQELRARTPVAISANEGLWSAAEAYRQIAARTADVYCFSPYFCGSLTQFQRLCWVAALEGLQVCKHTHGELGITATSMQHLMLTLPNVVEGNQQTAHMMQDDILRSAIPIASGPDWGVPDGPGLGLAIDEEKLGRYHELYRERGQFLPYDSRLLGTALRRV